MKKISTLFLFIVSILFATTAQEINKPNSTVQEYANTITPEDLKSHLSILASDALEGRETGRRGQKLAATYISSHFEELELQGPVESNCVNSFYQKVDLNYYTMNDIYVLLNDQKLKIGEQLYYKGASFNAKDIQTEAVFGGSGSIAELDAIDYSGKSVLIINDNRRQRSAALKHIREHGGEMLFAVTKSNQQDFDESISLLGSTIQKSKIGLAQYPTEDQSGIFYVGPELIAAALKTKFSKLEELIAKAKEGKIKPLTKVKSIEFTYNLDFSSEAFSSENVLGYLEGTDLKDELLVISSHYDHEGVKEGQIYNGADDNGSGTSAVLDIAEAFALAKTNGHGPRRSILFMTVTGEEKGLLGSKYYTNNPVFPLEQTVTNLNIDMIGRRGFGKEDNDNYVFVIGADRLSSELHDINEMSNTLYTNLELDYTYNDENDKNRFYYRSDHYNFAKNNIPIIFYFNGVHVDYHKPTDTVEKIEFDLLAKRARLVFCTAWEVANRDHRLVVDKAQE